MNDKNSNKSPTKFDLARQAAQTKDAARASGEAQPTISTELVPMPDAAAAQITQLGPDELKAMMATLLAKPGAVMAPQLLTLKIGQSISGSLVRGPGAVLEKYDERSKETYEQEVPNWIMTSGGVPFALLETSQLKTSLPPFNGSSDVTIIRGEDFNVSDKRVTRYIVIGTPATAEQQAKANAVYAKSSPLPAVVTK